MASCIRNIRTKAIKFDHFFSSYDDKNVSSVFMPHSVFKITGKLFWDFVVSYRSCRYNVIYNTPNTKNIRHFVAESLQLRVHATSGISLLSPPCWWRHTKWSC